MLSPSNLEKLEWSLLLGKLAGYAQTGEGRDACLSLTPTYDPDDIHHRWSEVTALRDIARSGYKAPIGDLQSPLAVFKACEKGQILEGPDFIKIHDILMSTKKVIGFAGSFAPKSTLLQKMRGTLYPLPTLLQLIEKTVGPDGLLRDDASPELAEIRQLKTNLRKRIEDVLARLLVTPEIADYLQDNFYTVRNDKYVIPIRLDGRGRIKGYIVDTSDSGQTLFLEPASVSQMNQDLHDLDVAEKLEIIRIFRDLSAAVARDLDPLRTNYDNLIDLDIKTAEACLAQELDAGAVQISETPCLCLIEARHPLIKTPSGKTAEPNTIILKEFEDSPQRVLIVSGPNAGGKTVVLKTVGLLHLMAKAGLLLPVEPTSKIYFFRNLFLEMGDSQNITANLSTFSGHLLGLKPILESASREDLVLLDELATGTEPRTGSAIARAILEHLAGSQITTIATTHFDDLKGLALEDQRYRNASMEYEISTYRPTYRLILDVPGQSYGLELATQMGLPENIIERARSVRGDTHAAFDDAITSLQKARQESESLKLQFEKELIDAQAAKARWEHECKLLEDQRAKVARSIAAKIETEVDTLRSEFEDRSRELKAVVKEIRTGGVTPEIGYEKKRSTEAKLRDLEKTVAGMASSGRQSDLPGVPVKAEELTEGLPVYVLPLMREGVIVKLGQSSSDPIDVQVGLIKVRVALIDLRKTRAASAEETKGLTKKTSQQPTSTQPKPELPDFVPQTALNTLDLRGTDADSAITKTLNFIDQCMRRDERYAVVIHGHGTDRLKNSIRSMLKNSCPYNVAFRPGSANEGGDGVTVISIG